MIQSGVPTQRSKVAWSSSSSSAAQAVAKTSGNGPNDGRLDTAGFGYAVLQRGDSIEDEDDERPRRRGSVDTLA